LAGQNKGDPESDDFELTCHFGDVGEPRNGRGQHPGHRGTDARRQKQLKHLDALAKNVYQKNPEKLHAWQSARHVEHAPQPQATTPTPTATAPAK
jgi:hypothetical protein